MVVRQYRAQDLPRIIEIFECSVSAACGEYSPEQLSAWQSADFSDWHARFENSLTLVAEEGGAVLAFGNIHQFAENSGLSCGKRQLRAGDGYLDMLYTAPNFMRRGAAAKICDCLGPAVKGDIYADVSKTALPFFAARGYSVITPQTVVRRGVEIQNFAVVLRRSRA